MDWLAGHWDQSTLTDDERLSGRLNVNTCDYDVLLSLPGVMEQLADAICQRRQGTDGPFYSVGEWI